MSEIDFKYLLIKQWIDEGMTKEEAIALYNDMASYGEEE